MATPPETYTVRDLFGDQIDDIEPPTCLECGGLVNRSAMHTHQHFHNTLVAVLNSLLQVATEREEAELERRGDPDAD